MSPAVLIVTLAGKVVIVTGANAGIGYHIALELARRLERTQMVVVAHDQRVSFIIWLMY